VPPHLLPKERGIDRDRGNDEKAACAHEWSLPKGGTEENRRAAET
jgi:hypothetical protein